MSRRYEVIVEAGAVKTNGVSDLITIFGGTGKVLHIIRWWVKFTDNSLATAQMIPTRCRRYTATVTTGSGGAAVTPRPVDGGDAAATFTARGNDTTAATTSGSTHLLDAASSHIYNGYEQQPEEPFTIGPTEAFVFQCSAAALQGSPNASFGVEVDEIG
jgi:hypothetical protein